MILRLAFLLLLLLSAPTHADVEAVFTDGATRLRFPPSIAGFKYLQTDRYPDPRLGVCVVYRGGDGDAQFCIFNLGQSSIPTGAASPVLRDALKHSTDALLRLINTPPYFEGKHVLSMEPKIESEGRVATGTAQLFESTRRRQDGSTVELSHAIAMTAVRDNLLKLNLTTSRRDMGEMAGLGTALVKELMEFNASETDAFWVKPRTGTR